LLLPLLEFLSEPSPLLLLPGQQIRQHSLVPVSQLRHQAVQIILGS
jgi:hypothetical protein